MKVDQIVKKCVDEILKQKAGREKFLVAVTGDSGSGKSFYSGLIREEFEKRGVAYSYLNADDFLISRQDREPMKKKYYEEGEFRGKSYWEILENMFRLDEFARVIRELRQDGKAKYRAYSRDTGMVGEEEVSITAEELVIFDTSMLLEKMDMIIMIEVEMEEIINRKIKRDADIRLPKEVEEMHRKVQGYYWQREKPNNPQIVIDNNDFQNPAIRVR
jgi:uridine kinase